MAEDVEILNVAVEVDFLGGKETVELPVYVDFKTLYKIVNDHRNQDPANRRPLDAYLIDLYKQQKGQNPWEGSATASAAVHTTRPPRSSASASSTASTGEITPEEIAAYDINNVPVKYKARGTKKAEDQHQINVWEARCRQLRLEPDIVAQMVRDQGKKFNPQTGEEI